MRRLTKPSTLTEEPITTPAAVATMQKGLQHLVEEKLTQDRDWNHI
jgi:hypothetical protein